VDEDGRAGSYRAMFDAFITDREVDTDPATWSATVVDDWRRAYRRWDERC
jgi:hypothetical protein